MFSLLKKGISPSVSKYSTNPINLSAINKQCLKNNQNESYMQR